MAVVTDMKRYAITQLRKVWRGSPLSTHEQGLLVTVIEDLRARGYVTIQYGRKITFSKEGEISHCHTKTLKRPDYGRETGVS